MKKKTAEAAYKTPLLDRIIKPRTITLPNGHTVQKPVSRTPFIAVIVLIVIYISAKVTGFDFGIIIISGASHNLQLLPMTTSQIVACVPENSPLAAKDRLTKEDIAAANVIMLKEGSFLRQTILGKLKEQSITPNIVLESNQVVTIKGLVASGVGISFLLDMVLEDAPGVKAIPLEVPLFVDVGLAWKKDRYISKAAQSFIDFCRDTLRKHKDKEEDPSQP